jgi:hypothetical protein
VHILPLVPGWCAEALMDSDGYWRCHRAEHGVEGEHHAYDRAWTGRQAVGTVWLRVGVSCGPDCTYRD